MEEDGVTVHSVVEQRAQLRRADDIQQDRPWSAGVTCRVGLGSLFIGVGDPEAPYETCSRIWSVSFSLA
jgi:hypothetical protein